MMGWEIEGVAELLALDGVDAPIHVHREEAFGVKRVTGASDSDLVLHDGGDVVHGRATSRSRSSTRPGHTPGSQCFLVDGRLVAGDTLFLDGCGRTDLPGRRRRRDVLQPHAASRRGPRRHRALSRATMYSPEPSATMGETRQRNYVFRLPTIEQWRMMLGA